MELLFNIDKKGTIVFVNEALDLCPELRFLNPSERLYLILSVDYYTPYRQFPAIERVNKALNHVRTVMNETVNNTSQKMLIAIDCYKSLQYDIKRAEVEVYKNKLQQLNADLQSASSSTSIKHVLDSKVQLRKAIEELEQEIEMNIETKSLLKGNGTLSFLEELKSRKELYENITKSRNG